MSAAEPVNAANGDQGKAFGNRCMGHKFTIPTTLGDLQVRRCAWDGEMITPAQQQGEKCKNCERFVLDRELTSEEVFFQPADAVYVQNVYTGIWELCAIPEGSKLIQTPQ